MCDSLVEIRPGLRQAIDLMEAVYGSVARPWGVTYPSWREGGPWLAEGMETLEEELAVLEYSPERAVLIDQAEAIWQLTVCRQVPAVWFIRTHRPVVVLVSALWERARVGLTRVLNGELDEKDFARLTLSAGVLGRAPLRICDARQPGALLRWLPKLLLENPGCSVFCDWDLEGKDLAEAWRLGKESEMTFFCPA